MPGRRLSVIPQAARTHRTTITVVDSPIPPLASNADWDTSEGYPLVRFYVTVAFTGGTNPTAVLSIWVRQKEGAGAFVVARSPLPDDRFTFAPLIITGDDQVAFDALTEGDDYLVLVEDVTGSPSSFSVDVKASGR